MQVDSRGAVSRGGAMGACCAGGPRYPDEEGEQPEYHTTSPGHAAPKPERRKNIFQMMESLDVKYKTEDDAPLLPPRNPGDARPCLVLDMDETLIAASFDYYLPGADYIIPISYNSVGSTGLSQYELTAIGFIKRRPYLLEFLEEVAKDWEIVVMTAGVSDYANPIIDAFDRLHLITHRLFRDSCSFDNATRTVYKNLSILGRDIKRTVIVDNSPKCYMFHKHNAIAITTWENGSKDKALSSLLPVLRVLAKESDIPKALDGMNLGTFGL